MEIDYVMLSYKKVCTFPEKLKFQILRRSGIFVHLFNPLTFDSINTKKKCRSFLCFTNQFYSQIWFIINRTNVYYQIPIRLINTSSRVSITRWSSEAEKQIVFYRSCRRWLLSDGNRCCGGIKWYIVRGWTFMHQRK